MQPSSQCTLACIDVKISGFDGDCVPYLEVRILRLVVGSTNTQSVVYHSPCAEMAFAGAKYCYHPKVRFRFWGFGSVICIHIPSWDEGCIKSPPVLKVVRSIVGPFVGLNLAL